MHPMLLLLSALLGGGPTPARLDRPAVERRLVFDQRPGRSLQGVLLAPGETTPPLSGYDLLEVDAQGSRKLADHVGAALWTGDGAVLLVRKGVLMELRAGHTRTLAQGLEPDLAIDPAGRAVAVVRREGPTRTIIELLDRRDGALLRRLVAGEGVNNAPLFTPDGKALLFVSSRTGLSSLFRVGVDGQGERQLTNGGKTAVDQAYVPPPERTLERRFDAGLLHFQSGLDRWQLDPATGSARRLEGGAP